jgi:hypothetical protein
MDSNRELAQKIAAMEKRYDEKFAVVFDTITLGSLPEPQTYGRLRAGLSARCC